MKCYKECVCGEGKSNSDASKRAVDRDWHAGKCEIGDIGVSVA